VKIRDLIYQVEAAGWVLSRTRGDHRQYTHPTRPGLVTISGHLGDDVQPRNLASVRRQAGLPPQHRRSRRSEEGRR
jgi:predicted RNA binding protein YcfA (HicA-like mRNA interferase family)